MVSVKRLACICVLMLLPVLSTHVRAADDRSPELNKLLKSVESRYNHAQSMKLDFSETYAGMRRPAQSDSGVL